MRSSGETSNSSGEPVSGLTYTDLNFFDPGTNETLGLAGEPISNLLSGKCKAAAPSTASVPRPRDAMRSMLLLKERIEFAAGRLERQVGALNGAKMEAFGYVEDLDVLDASSFEETVNGRLGLVEHQLDRLENVILHFGTTH